MPQIYYDVLLGSVFVIVLTAAWGYKSRFARADRQALNRIITGLFFLIAFVIVQALGRAGVFQDIAFLRAEANQELLASAAVFGGLMFLLIGISALLPTLVKKGNGKTSLTKKYTGLKMLNRAVADSHDFDAALRRTMSIMHSYLDMEKVAGFKFIERKDTLILVDSFGFPDRYPEGLRQIKLANSGLKDAIYSMRPTRELGYDLMLNGNRRPGIIIPVTGKDRIYGAMLCWSDKAVNHDEDLLDFMEAISGLLGRQAEYLIDRTRLQFYRSQNDAIKNTVELCNGADSVETVTRDMFRHLHDQSGVEYLSLAVLDNSGENMRRYSIGSTGRLLLEKGINHSTLGSEIYRIFKNGQPVLRSEIDPERDAEVEDGLFLSCGMRSRISYPIKSTGRVLAVLTLGHTESGRFKRLDLHRIDVLTDIIAGVVQRHRLRHSLEVREDHMLRLQLLERAFVNGQPLENIFGEACELLTKRMEATVARISLLDQAGENLVSQSCRSIRDLGVELNDNGSIPLSLTPWHRMVKDNGKLMLINQRDTDSRMPAQEITSSLVPGINSALLVPIHLDGKVQGVISIGEQRNWNRRAFGASDLLFAKDVATKCSLALRIKKMNLQSELHHENLVLESSSGYNGDDDIKRRLKGPLTSIIGSIEFLKRKDDGDTTRARFHEMIMKAADKIRVAIEEEPVSVETIEETEKELIPG